MGVKKYIDGNNKRNLLILQIYLTWLNLFKDESESRLNKSFSTKIYPDQSLYDKVGLFYLFLPQILFDTQ